MAAIEECCGLGCNNCVLDCLIEKSARRELDSDKINLFNHKSYQKFCIKSIKKERETVYQLTFGLVCDREKMLNKDEQLMAPPVSYLMMRAEREFEDTVLNPIFSDCQELFRSQNDEDSVTYHRTQPQRFDKGTPEVYFSRKYTPYEVNEELRTFKIIVKMEPFGKMSRYFTTLNVGSICEFKGPFEAFSYVHEKIENYIVFTQGISVVSAFRLVKEIIYESAQSRILVVSCFKNINETFLREDFFKLTAYWCLKYHVFLSQNVEAETAPRTGENIHSERLDGENFKSLLKELKFFDPNYTQILVSGRDGFIDFVKTIARENRYQNVATI